MLEYDQRLNAGDKMCLRWFQWVRSDKIYWLLPWTFYIWAICIYHQLYTQQIKCIINQN